MSLARKNSKSQVEITQHNIMLGCRHPKMAENADAPTVCTCCGHFNI